MKPSGSQDNTFINALKSAGERVTSPRLHLFRLLRQNSPVSMTTLRQKAKLNGIDTVTVYRSVALFMKMGLLQEIGMGSHRMLELTDDFDSHHHHLWCSHCGQLLDFDDQQLEDSMHAMAKRLGFKIDSHQLEIVGICRMCLTKLKPGQRT